MKINIRRVLGFCFFQILMHYLASAVLEAVAMIQRERGPAVG